MATSRTPQLKGYVCLLVCLLLSGFSVAAPDESPERSEALRVFGGGGGEQQQQPSFLNTLRDLNALPTHVALKTIWPDEPLPPALENPHSATFERTASIPAVPSNEFQLNSGMYEVGAPDMFVKAFSRSDGSVCLLHLEGFRLRALVSRDNGLSFGPEVDVAGLPLSPDVFNYAATLADDGLLYVALGVADGEDGLGLQFVKSADMGATWGAPQTLIAPGSTAHGIDQAHPSPRLVIDANAQGRIAIGFTSFRDVGVRVVASSDHGNTWTAAALLNDPPPGPGYAFFDLAVAVAPVSGTIHFAFGDNDVYPSRVQVTRSTDGGLTFDPLLNVMDFHPYVYFAEGAALAVANDGSVLLACHVDELDFSYGYGVDVLRVFRSTDDGESYTPVLREVPLWGGGYYGFAMYPVFAVEPQTSTVLLAYRDSDRKMLVHRSEDHGASFGSPQDLTGTSVSSRTTRPVIVQTPGGGWAIAWNTLSYTDPFIALRRSPDGISWDEGELIPSVYLGLFDPFDMTAVGPDHLLLAFAGDDGTYELNVTATRAAFTDPEIPPRWRIDGDAAMVQPSVGYDPTVVSDGDQHVYTLFVAWDDDSDGSYGLFLRASADRALSFAQPVRIPTVPDDYLSSPLIAATPDGHVYIAYLHLSAFPEDWEVRLRSSHDFGLTWSEASTAISLHGYLDYDSLALAAAEGGEVYASIQYSDYDEDHLMLARSTDGGASFATSRIDSIESPSLLDSTSLCAAGGRLFVAWTTYYSIEATYSDDAGETFAPAAVVALGHYSLRERTLGCHDSGRALLAWKDTSPGYYDPEVWSSRFDGSSWQPTVLVVGVDEGPGEEPMVTFTGSHGEDVIVMSRRYVRSGVQSDMGMYASRSTDGGETFDTVRLDQQPGVGSFSWGHRIVSDGEGNVWASWFNTRFASAPTSFVIRRSIDGGAGWGDVKRVDRKEPAGVYSNVESVSSSSAALPSIGFFAWRGERDSFIHDPLLNTDDIYDADRDGSPVGADCDDENPTTYPGAPQLCDGINNDCDDAAYPDPPADEFDTDSDGPLSCADNCPDIYNPDQLDSDSDGVGDLCENEPPVAHAGVDAGYECTSPAGALVTLDGSGSTDPDSTPGTNDDIVLFEWFEAGDPLGIGEVLDVILPLGTHVITLQVTDSAGDSDTDGVVIDVVDITPPWISVELSPTLLWPPNHGMNDINATVVSTDTCSEPTVVLESIQSSEADDMPGMGDGATVNDIQNAEYGTSDFVFSLRAERSGSGSGRTYTVTYSATDTSDNQASSSAIVFVPHSMNPRQQPDSVGQGDEGVQPFSTSDGVETDINISPRGDLGKVRNTEERGARSGSGKR